MEPTDIDLVEFAPGRTLTTIHGKPVMAMLVAALPSSAKGRLKVALVGQVLEKDGKTPHGVIPLSPEFRMEMN